jgi:hypothetical protein
MAPPATYSTGIGGCASGQEGERVGRERPPTIRRASAGKEQEGGAAANEAVCGSNIHSLHQK